MGKIEIRDDIIGDLIDDLFATVKSKCKKCGRNVTNREDYCPECNAVLYLDGDGKLVLEEIK